jgi:hypothetical protein
MFAQPYPTAISNFSLSEEARFYPKGITVGDVGEVPVPQQFDILSREPDKFGANLFIVPNNNDLSCEIVKEKGFRTGLAGLIDNHNVERLSPRAEGLCHTVEGHDPGRDGRAALLHMLACRPAVHRGVFAFAFTNAPHGVFPRHKVLPLTFAQPQKTTSPGFRGRQLTNELTTTKAVALKVMNQGHLCSRIGESFEPSIGASPVPGVGKVGQAVVPSRIRKSRHKTRCQVGSGLLKSLEEIMTALEGVA